MTRLLQILFLGCLVLLPVAWLNTDTLPGELPASPALAEEPRQTSVQETPLNVQLGDVNYEIEPQYHYALDGIVVSYRVHDADRLLHRIWNDHLNVADLCVVWGSNVDRVDLHAFEFANGQFTCTFRTRSDKAWRSFRTDQISNNHLITADSAIRKRISDVAVGDRIHLEGFLASYSNGSGFSRGTSTTRKDTGNGACETVYVTGFDIVEPATRRWRHLQSAAWWGMLLSGSLWLFGVGDRRS
jgi:hypothetical protein